MTVIVLLYVTSCSSVYSY